MRGRKVALLGRKVRHAGPERTYVRLDKEKEKEMPRPITVACPGCAVNPSSNPAGRSEPDCKAEKAVGSKSNDMATLTVPALLFNAYFGGQTS